MEKRPEIIARAFQQRYGISMDIITGRGAEFLERLKIEKCVIVGIVGAVVMAKSIHPNAGNLFTNWLMFEEGQNTESHVKATPPIRKGVPDGSPLSVRMKVKKLIPTSTEDAAIKFSEKFVVPLWKK